MSQLTNYPIAQWREEYGLSVLIETGTYRGVSTHAALVAGYERAVTCDVAPEFVQAFLDSLPTATRARVTAFVGRSVNVLPAMLAAAANVRAALVFLDAHVDPKLFDGRLTSSDGGDPLPIRREIEILLAQRDCARDVVLIDDMALCTDELWKTGELHRTALRPSFRCVADIAALFPGHRAELIQPNDTALALFPRKIA